MFNTIKYNNLGANCGHRNIYIRSTDIEAKRWDKLLLSFPDEALYFLSKGYKIAIVDKCKKKRGKVERIFCPVMENFLCYLTGSEYYNKGLNEHTLLAIQAYNSNPIIKAKYNFFRNKLKSINVVGKTIYCKKEPNVWRKGR